jgi:glutaminyl-tRNA synthetase
VTEGYVEPSVADDPPETRYQFERLGYFWQDPVDSRPDALVFDQIVSLKDSWSRRQEAGSRGQGEAKTPPSTVHRPPSTETPRDPASALNAEQREVHDALVARGVGEEEAAVLAADPELLALFEQVVGLHDAPRDAGVLLVHELRPALGEDGLAASKAEAPALAVVEAGTLTRGSVREVIASLVADGGSAAAVIEARGLAAVRDDATLAPVVDAVVEAHPDEVARYRAGEARLLGFFTGQVMRRAGKGADAQAVQRLLRERLGG